MKITALIPIFLLLIFHDLYSQQIQVFSDQVNAIELRNDIIVYISEGREVSSRIENPDNSVFPNVSVSVLKNNTLIIDSEKKMNKINQSVVHITLRNLKKINLTGSGKIILSDSFYSEELRIENSGSGNITATINCKSLKVRLTGSGDLVLKGKSVSANIQMIGSGKLEAESLKISKCVYNSTGSGAAKMDVTDNLNAKFSGSGNLYVLTYPVQVYSQSDGSGGLLLLKS
jgi:hypothetical protein